MNNSIVNAHSYMNSQCDIKGNIHTLKYWTTQMAMKKSFPLNGKKKKSSKFMARGTNRDGN